VTATWLLPWQTYNWVSQTFNFFLCQDRELPQIMQLHLKKFDMASLKDNSIVVLLGKRDTGKSWLVRDLLWHHKDIPVGTVICPTENVNPFYSEMVPSLFIHEKASPDLLASVTKRQKIISKKVAVQKTQRGTSHIDPRAFLVMDDCLYDRGWGQDENIRFLFMNGRHVKTLVLITMQYPLGVLPNLRTNIDYVFILRETNIKSRQKIYENYAGVFPTFDSFCDCLDQTTENYECMVINNNAKSNKLQDSVFWYKAEEREGFKMGAPDFWRLHHELCEEGDGEEEDGELMDITKFRSKRKGPNIAVKKTLF
jgi:hypothetical protein